MSLNPLKAIALIAITVVPSGPVVRPAAPTPPGACLVSTAYGDLQGSIQTTTCTFTNVPYAASAGGRTAGGRRSPPRPGRVF
jgi:hypothetical protein